MRNVPVCVGLHSVLWRAGSRERIKASAARLVSHSSSLQEDSARSTPAPTPGDRPPPDGSSPSPADNPRRHRLERPDTNLRPCPNPGSGRASRRLCTLLCILLPRPDHARLRRRSHQPRLGAPRSLHPACYGPGLQRAMSVRSRSSAALPRRREPGAGRLRLLPRLRQAAGRTVYGA